jgi:hypothetical protein
MYLGSSSMPATGKSIDVQLIDIIRLGDDSFALEPAPAVAAVAAGSGFTAASIASAVWGFPAQCRLTCGWRAAGFC